MQKLKSIFPLSHRKLNLHHKLNRWNFIKTGLVIFSLTLCFICNRNYFWYPPSLAPAWNNIWVDIVGLFAGVILIICGALDLHVDIVVKTGLGVSVAYLTVLIIAESFHVVGANYIVLVPLMILEAYTIANLMQIAYEYEPEQC